MSKRKRTESSGKPGLSQHFQEFNTGDYVAFVKEPSATANISLRYQGRTGIITGKQGRAYIVEIKDGNKKKKFLISPIHLKKIKQIKTTL